MSFFEELKRRKVFRVSIGYLVIAWLLMQLGDTLGPALRLPEWIPSALAFFLILGFPVAIYLAWVYEMTPDGIKPDSTTGKTPQRQLDSGKLNRVILIGVLLAVTYFAVDRFVLNGQDQQTKQAGISPSEGQIVDSAADGNLAPANSIAVLPFINMSSDPEQEYFSDGLSEELLNLLARIPELQVTSRSSAFAFKGKEINIPEVASSLGVAHILEGSVRKSGDQIRVTVQLIDAARDVHLWSATYDHTLENIYSIQDEISAAVVSALKLTLLGETPKARNIDPRAMDLNLQAHYFWQRRSDGDFERARDYYQKSIDIDASNAPAWAGLAVIYNEMIRFEQMPEEEAQALFKQAALNAVEADPDYPEGHIRLSWAYSREGDEDAARNHWKIANRLDPNNHLVVFDHAVTIMRSGRLYLAIEHFERLAKLAPLSAISHGNLATFYTELGRLEDADAAITRAIELSPGSSNQKNTRATIRVMQGRYEEALELIADLSPGNETALLSAVIHFALGNEKAAQAAYDEIVQQGTQPAEAWQMKILAFRGELEPAFEMLERGVSAGIRFYFFLNDPYLRNMHADPRWELLMRKAGRDPEASFD